MRKAIVVVGILLAGCAQSDAEKALEGVLKDPSSAEYRNISSSWEWVCGEVNAKNSYGGYTGYQPFLINRRSGRVELFNPTIERAVPTDIARTQFEQMARKYC